MFDPPPTDRLPRLGTKYKDQVHINAADGLWYAPMNVNLAALRQRQGAAGGELRDRPQRAGQPVRRPGAGLAGLPGPAAGLPRA